MVRHVDHPIKLDVFGLLILRRPVGTTKRAGPKAAFAAWPVSYCRTQASIGNLEPRIAFVRPAHRGLHPQVMLPNSGLLPRLSAAAPSFYLRGNLPKQTGQNIVSDSCMCAPAQACRTGSCAPLCEFRPQPTAAKSLALGPDW